MRTPESLSVADAASRAAAAYVWNGSHQKGLEAGWAAGWAAAMTEMSEGPTPDERKLDVPKPLEEELDPSSNDENYELDSEWAALFVNGAARRAAERRADNIENAKRRRVALDLGGAAEAARIHDAKKMYGEDATRLLETEAGLLATFDELVARSKASLWPVLSIREGEAPRKTS